MKIVFGQGVAEGRGKLGGTVFSRNASGAYARRYVKPVNPSTLAQQAVRAQFANLASAYRGLSAGEQNSFIVQAPNYPQQDKVGNTITLTGQQLFNKMNMAVSTAGSAQPITTAVPPLNNLPEVIQPGVEILVAQEIVPNTTFRTFVAGVPTVGPNVPAGFRAVVEATRAFSPGYSRFKDSDYKQIATVAATQIIPDLDASNYGVLFGAFVEGAQYSFRVKLVSTNTGQTTPAVAANFIYTAP